jgi:hypothetical protein
MKVCIVLAAVGLWLALHGGNLVDIPGAVNILELVGGFILMFPLALLMAWGNP